MNFDAINKMCDAKVLELLNNVDNANATKQLLLITRYVLDSYINKSISIELKIYYIWYATFFYDYREHNLKNKILLSCQKTG